MSTTEETTKLFTMLVRALVDDEDTVMVTVAAGPGGSIGFTVRVSSADAGKVIGQGGRTARAIRLILGGIARKNGANYSLDVGGFGLGSGEE